MTEETNAAEAPEFEDMDYDTALAHLRSGQNFGLAIAAGLGASVVGAIVWALVVYVTNYEIGLIAIALGALVGIAIRITGKGVDQKFGILGGTCAAFGWGLGTLLGDVGLASRELGLPFGETFATVDLMALVSALASPMDLLFLAIAVYEGYKFAFLHRL